MTVGTTHYVIAKKIKRAAKGTFRNSTNKVRIEFPAKKIAVFKVLPNAFNAKPYKNDKNLDWNKLF